MKKLSLGSATTLAVVVGLLGVAGCKTTEPEPAHQEPEPGGAWIAIPTGVKSTSVILLEQFAPSEVRANSEYDYAIDVTNLTDQNLENVEVHAIGFSNMTVVSSTPSAKTMTADDIYWLIGDLPAHAKERISLKAKAAAAGVARNCLTARYATVLCVATNVVSPALQLTKTATPELCGTCDDIRLVYEVKNSGTGIIEQTKITDTLPAGVTTADGKTTVEIAAGNLAAGQSKPFTVMAKAAKPGTYASAATATANMGLKATSPNPSTVVKSPALTVSCDSTGKVYVGRDITYKFTVKNTGDCPASNAVVAAPLPNGVTFVGADNGGRSDGKRVTWSMPSVAPGQSATVSMTVKPTAIGSVPLTASAQATCVPPTSSNCSTDVAGIPAILLEVVDTNDPVEVGNTTTFIITATNQGSAADTNVMVVGTLPPQMEFVSGTGPSPVTASGQTVTMSAVPTLAPKAKAEWRIVARAKAEGDTRSKWEMTSTQFKVPVTETESTNVYK